MAYKRPEHYDGCGWCQQYFDDLTLVKAHEIVCPYNPKNHKPPDPDTQKRPMPKANWKCHTCGDEFKTYDSYYNHSCPKVGGTVGLDSGDGSTQRLVEIGERDLATLTRKAEAFDQMEKLKNDGIMGLAFAWEAKKIISSVADGKAGGE